VSLREEADNDGCDVGEAEQIAERGLTPVWKLDSRFHSARQHEAWEADALGQSMIVRLVRMPWTACCPNLSTTFWKQSSGCGSLSSSTASTSELRYEHGRDP
jgi:hypothetical protein